MKLDLLHPFIADEIGEGSVLWLLLFALALVAVGLVVMISIQKRWWQITAMTSCIWFVLGLMMQPWTLLPGHEVALDPDAAYCWKVAIVLWAVMLLVCLICLTAILMKEKSSHRGGGSGSSGRDRRRRRSRHSHQE
jgi:hypothetical protein